MPMPLATHTIGVRQSGGCSTRGTRVSIAFAAFLAVFCPAVLDALASFASAAFVAVFLPAVLDALAAFAIS